MKQIKRFAASRGLVSGFGLAASGFRRLAALAALCLCGATLAQAQKVTGSAPKTVAQGSRFNLTYSVDAKADNITLPQLEGFTILYGPSASTSSSMVFDGSSVKRSEETRYTYVLRADKEGSFEIGAATVTVGGKPVRSNSVEIQVVKGAAQQGQSPNSQAPNQGGQGNRQTQPAQASGDKNIIIEQSLNNLQAYEGEGVVLTTKIYTRADLSSISDIKQPGLNDFIMQEFETEKHLQFSREMRDGQVWSVAIADERLLIPQKSGKINIGATQYEFIVRQRVSRGNGGFFGSFFDDVQMVRQTVKSNSLTLNVKPLPQPRPSGFCGGVGDFRFDVTVSQNEVEVNNSLQVKVKVSGEGNLKILTMPKPQIHQDFDTYDPNEQHNYKTTSRGYNGSRTAEYLLVPRHEGEFTIPAMDFTYFSTLMGKYVTLTRGPFTIKVSKGEGGADQQPGTVVVSQGGEAVTYQTIDLRYLHNNLSLAPKNDFLVLSPLFWMLLLAPPAVLLALLAYYRKRLSDIANMTDIKRRKASKMARKRLKKAEAYIKQNQRENFFDEVMRAMWGYLSDKLSLPLSDLTKDNAREQMRKHNIDEAKAEEFMSVLEACEFARYAPAELSDKPVDIYNRAATVLSDIG